MKDMLNMLLLGLVNIIETAWSIAHSFTGQGQPYFVKIAQKHNCRNLCELKNLENWSMVEWSPSRGSIVEKVAGFDIPVNDMMRVNVAEGNEQASYVALHLARCHQVKVILSGGDIALNQTQQYGLRSSR